MIDFVNTADLITMEPDIKARWVSDLRSGNFEQTTGILKSANNEFCCLGVLSEQAAEFGVCESELADHGELYRYSDGGDFTATALLLKSVSKWAGLTQEHFHDSVSVTGLLPFKGIDGYTVYLDTLNDGGMPFSQIADLIEYWY